MSKILKSVTLGDVKNGGIFRALGKEFVKLDADSAEQAVEKAKEQAENHYPEYEKFEVQAIEIERRSK